MRVLDTLPPGHKTLVFITILADYRWRFCREETTVVCNLGLQIHVGRFLSCFVEAADVRRDGEEGRR